MFKDFYKAANDDITPPPYILSKILNNACGKQKTFHTPFKSTAAAAVILIVLSLYIFTLKNANDASPEIVMNINNINFAINEAASIRMFSDFSTTDQNEITAGDYFKSLDLSLTTLDIPKSLSPDFNENTPVIPASENTFSYTGEYFLTITLYPSPEIAQPYFENDDYKKSRFKDNDVVMLFDGTFYQVYTIHKSGAAIKITTDLPEDDLKKLIISILK